MWLNAATAAASSQHYPEKALYVVATPIGNIADISLRAIYTLSLVDAVACEDTRVSAGLLRHLGLHKPLIALHQHNEAGASDAILARLQRGERIALVTDAGTPAISDPGARLVARIQNAGACVVPLPGPSAVTTALSAAGDAQGEGFCFVGFLPSSGKAREDALQKLLDNTMTTVCFEAPHRIEALASILAKSGSMRKLTICRELSKQFEEIQTLCAQDLPAWLNAHPHRQRGEFVVVLHAQPVDPQASLHKAMPLLEALLPLLPLKQAVGLVAAHTGAARNQLYEKGLMLKIASPSSSP